MGRLLGLILFLTLVGSAALHMDADLSTYGSWIGQLPGDLIVKKGKVVIYLPFMSAALAGGLISLVLSLFRRKRRSED